MNLRNLLVVAIVFSLFTCRIIPLTRLAVAKESPKRDSQIEEAGELRLNEIYPIPSDGKEYIELYNSSTNPINLDEYLIYDVSSPEQNGCTNEGLLKSLEGQIMPEEFLIIELSSARLNNDGDKLKLIDSEGTEIDRLEYGICGEIDIEKGNTVGYGEDSEKQRLSPTPGNRNYLMTISELRITGKMKIGETITFVAYDNVSEEYFSNSEWLVNDENIAQDINSAEYEILEAGSYTVSYSVSDIFGSETFIEKEFEVKESSEEQQDYSGLRINEIYPSPDSNEEEWVEIFNSSSKKIDMSGVILDDIVDGGSSPYTIPEDTIINSKEYLVIDGEKSDISFNNSGDEVTLIDQDGNIISKIEYPSTEKGTAYALVEDEWVFTTYVTPGKENVGNSEGNQSDVLKISEAKELVGSSMSIEGVISATTGEAANEIAYIQDKTGGLRVKTENELVRGSRYRLEGEMREAWGEHYLSLTELVFIEEAVEVIPIQLGIGDVSESSLSNLIEVSGFVTKTDGESFWLGNEKGEEVRVYLSDSLSWERPEWIKKETSLKVIGILSQWGVDENGDANLRILPRDSNDFSEIKSDSILGLSEEQNREKVESVKKNALLLPETNGSITLWPAVVTVFGAIFYKWGGVLIKRLGFGKLE